jgi:hypothetical protein
MQRFQLCRRARWISRQKNLDSEETAAFFGEVQPYFARLFRFCAQELERRAARASLEWRQIFDREVRATECRKRIPQARHSNGSRSLSLLIDSASILHIPSGRLDVVY